MKNKFENVKYVLGDLVIFVFRNVPIQGKITKGKFVEQFNDWLYAINDGDKKYLIRGNDITTKIKN